MHAQSAANLDVTWHACTTACAATAAKPNIPRVAEHCCRIRVIVGQSVTLSQHTNLEYGGWRSSCRRCFCKKRI